MVPTLWTCRSMAISEGRGFPDDSLQAWLGQLVEAGVEAVQIREKTLSDRQVYRLLVAARRYLPAELPLVVNRRWDLAVAAGADGVHLPSRGFDPGRIRQHVTKLQRESDARPRASSRPWWIGCSAHSLEEVQRAQRARADYATFGPVFPTPSKAGFGPPVGLELLRQANSEGLPLLALGGVDFDHLSACQQAGAFGVAAIRAFAELPSSRRLMDGVIRTWTPAKG